jgi:type I restriction enzyme S subunit
VENNEAKAQRLLALYTLNFDKLLCETPNAKTTLEKIAVVKSGKRPQIISDKNNGNLYPVIGASGIMGYTNETLIANPVLTTGRVGTHGIVQFYFNPIWASDNTLTIESEFLSFCYQALKRVDYNALNKGSTQPLITQGDIKKIPIFLPFLRVIKKYENRNSLKTVADIYVENAKLRELKALYLKSHFG